MREKNGLIPLAMKSSAITVTDKTAHARLLCDKGLWSEVLAFTKKWHTENPTAAAAWFFQGVALVGWGRFAEAETAYRRALTLQGNDFKTWSELAQLLFAHLHRREEGAKCLAQALQYDSCNKVGWANLATMNLQLGRSAAALDCAERALALDPKFASAQLHRARAAQQLGNLELVRAASEALGKLPLKHFCEKNGESKP